MDFLETQTTTVLSKALDGLAERHKAITGNIANSDTPGYRALQVSFEDNLRQAIEAENRQGQAPLVPPPGTLMTTDPRHISLRPLSGAVSDVQAQVAQSTFTYRYDNNGGDIEQQMAALAKNAQRYMAVSKLEAQSFSTLKSLINGGGG